MSRHSLVSAEEEIAPNRVVPSWGCSLMHHAAQTHRHTDIQDDMKLYSVA